MQAAQPQSGPTRGRPRTVESDRRRRAFVAAVLTGEPLLAAVEQSGIAPLRALAVFDQLEQARLIRVDREAAA